MQRFASAKEMADAILEAIKPLRPADPAEVAKFLRSISPTAMRGGEARTSQPIDVPAVPAGDEPAEEGGDATVQIGKRPHE